MIGFCNDFAVIIQNKKGRCFSLPRSRAEVKPLPKAMPFTAGMPNTAALSRDSSPSKKWAAYPGGHAQDPTFDDAAQAVASGLCLQDGLGHGLALGLIHHRERLIRRGGEQLAPVVHRTDGANAGRERKYPPAPAAADRYPPAAYSAAVIRPENGPPPGSMRPYFT